MTQPLMSGHACPELNCRSGYPGVHSDHCKYSDAVLCVVCGGKHQPHAEQAPGVCLLNDPAHRAAVARAFPVVSPTEYAA